MITNVNTTFFMRALLREESCGKFLFVCSTNQDTSFRMLRLRATMETDAGASRYLLQQRQQPLKFRRLRYLHLIYQRRYEVVCILKGVANGCQILFVLSCAS
jgi:hypothetical protein